MRKKSQARQPLGEYKQKTTVLSVKNEADMSPQLRDEFFAADFFGISVGTVRRWKLFGKGPRYRKIGGSVRYALNDLHEWLNACPSGGQKEAR